MKKPTEIQQQQSERISEIAARGRHRYLEAGGDPKRCPSGRKGNDYLTNDERQEILQGFQPVDFPDNPPYFDGNCYFAGTNDRSIAEEFNQSYKEGIIEVSIERTAYNQYFKALECRYDEKDGRDRIEVVVPQELFEILNQFLRVLKPE